MAKNSLRARITKLVKNDPTTIRDRESFYARWGEYPDGKKKSK